MKRRKNLERAVILGLLLSTSVYGSAWAREDTTPIQKPDLNEIIEEGDWKITTDKSALAYNGLVDIKKGDLIIIANGAGSNGIEAGYMEDEPAKLQIYANDINITSGANGLFTATEGANNSNITLGSADRKIQGLTINAGGQGIDNKNGNVYIYGADDSVFTIHSLNTSGDDLNQAAINNSSSNGEIIFSGGSISLTTENVYREYEIFGNKGMEWHTGDGITNANGTTTLNFNSVEMNVTGSGIRNTGSGTVSLNTKGNNKILANNAGTFEYIGYGLYSSGNDGTINVIASATYVPEKGYSTLNTQTGYDNIIYGQRGGVASDDTTNYGTKNIIADNNNYIGGDSAISSRSKNSENTDTINVIAGNNNVIGGNYVDKDNNKYTTDYGIGLTSVKNVNVNIESIKGATTIDVDSIGMNIRGSGENVKVSVTAGTDINVYGGNRGISVSNSDSKVTNDETSVELNAQNGNNKIIVNVKRGYGTGISNGKSQVKLDAINNTVGLFKGEKSNVEGAIYTNGNGNVLLEADNTNMILANSTEITTLADEVYGDKYAINANSEGTVDIKADVANKIIGAVYANDKATNVNIQSLNENTAAANYIASSTVIFRAGDLNQSEDETMKNLKVVSSLYAQSGAEINLSGKNTILTYANKDDDTTAERSVWAYDKGKINVDGYTYISTNEYDESPNSMDVAVAAGTATNLTEDSFDNYPVNDDELAKVNINYANDGKTMSYINGDILAAYAGEVNINPLGENSKAVNNAGIAIKGNLLAGNNGVLDVNLGKGGVLIGRADDYGDAGAVENSGHGTVENEKGETFYNPAFSSDIYKGGDITLTMGDGSQWNVQGQSWITNVNTNGNVTIDLTNVAEEYQGYKSHALTIRNLNVNNLNGSANIKMNLNGDRSQSDMLYIGQGKGEYNIELAELVKVSDMYAQSDDKSFNFSGLRFATVGAGSDVKFNVTAKDQGFNNVIYTVDTDVYNSAESAHENNAYNGENMTEEKPGNSLVEDLLNGSQTESAESGVATLAANDIMLLADENDTENDNKTQHLNYKLVDMQSDGPTDAGKTMLNMSRANYSNAIYMDRLNKRLGEARYINDDPEEDEGMWVRIRHDRIGKEDAFRSQNTMYELGYDKRQECDNGKRRVGFAVDYMHGDTGYSDIAGKGEIDRYGLWLYDTWTGNKGHYADYVAKWGHLQNDFEVYTMTGGEKVTGDYSNNVFSISAEYGRKKDMGNDWYIEPQAQLQLARVTGADYTTSQGTKVSVDGINSLIGRAGFRLGKDFGEEKQSTVYFKADVLHEFLGDQTIRAMDGTTNGWQTVDYENKGTWYDIGIGYAAMLSQSTYAFIDLEQSFGNDNDDTYQINAGVRWTF